MSVPMKTHHTNNQDYKVIVVKGGAEKTYYIRKSNLGKIEKELEKYAEDDEVPVAWEKLAKDRIAKYKKSGLVLRGMRYRENMSHIALVKKSGVSQNEISNIENGKRTVGKKIAMKLAKALNFDYRLLIEHE